MARLGAAGHGVSATIPRAVGSSWAAEQRRAANPGICVTRYPAPESVHGWLRRGNEALRLRKVTLARYADCLGQLFTRYDGSMRPAP